MDLLSVIGKALPIVGDIFGGDSKTETVVNYSKHRRSLEKAGYSPLANLNVNGAGVTTTSGGGGAALASQAILEGADLVGAVLDNAREGDKSEKERLANSVGIIETENQGGAWRAQSHTPAATRPRPRGAMAPTGPSAALPPNTTLRPMRTDGGPNQVDSGLPEVDVFGTGHTGLESDPELMPVGTDGVRTVDDGGNILYEMGATTVRANDGTQLTHTMLPMAAVEETFGESSAMMESLYQLPEFVRQRDPQLYNALNIATRRNPFTAAYRGWRTPDGPVPIIEPAAQAVGALITSEPDDHDMWAYTGEDHYPREFSARNPPHY